MTQRFGLGSNQPFVADDERSLRDNIEAAIEFCLETPSAFAMFEYGRGFCQLFLDQSFNMHIGNSFGVLVDSELPESDTGSNSPASNVLPSTLHERSAIAAQTMTRWFIDAGEMTFPAELRVEIISIGRP